MGERTALYTHLSTGVKNLDLLQLKNLYDLLERAMREVIDELLKRQER